MLTKVGLERELQSDCKIEAKGMAVNEVLTPTELPNVIGCKRTKVYELLRGGEILSYRVGRLRRILREDAERWREEQRSDV